MIIAHDMTRTERDECKRLVEEAKAKAAQDKSGEILYRTWYRIWTNPVPGTGFSGRYENCEDQKIS